MRAFYSLLITKHKIVLHHNKLVNIYLLFLEGGYQDPYA